MKSAWGNISPSLKISDCVDSYWNDWVGPQKNSKIRNKYSCILRQPKQHFVVLFHPVFSSYPLQSKWDRRSLPTWTATVRRSNGPVSGWVYTHKHTQTTPETVLGRLHSNRTKTHTFLTKQLHRLTNTWLDQILALWDDTKCPRSDTWQEDGSTLKRMQLTPARTSHALA